MFAAVCVVLAAAGHALASCDTIPAWSLGAGFVAVFAVAAPLAGRQRSLAGIAAMLAVGQTVLHTLFGLGQHGTPAATGTSAALDAALVERAARLVCGATAAAISPAQAQRILADAGLGTAGPGTGGPGAGGPGAGGLGAGGLGAHAAHDPADAMSTAMGFPMSVLPSVPMLLSHLLAAVAAGWVLRHGDLALLRIARLSTEGTLVGSLRAALSLVRALFSGLPGTPDTAPRGPCPAHEAAPSPRTTALQHTVIRRGPPSAAVLVLAA
ncbi:hypothetical protein GCM10023083_50290 [Streptomyces phyllanthi]